MNIVVDPRLPLGNRLRRLAAAQGIRPKDVADRLGVSVQYISKLYNGRKPLKPATLDSLIIALDLEYMAPALHAAAAREYGFRL